MTLSLLDQTKDLFHRFGSLSGITIEVHKELVAVQVDNQAASATFFLQGAQLTHYQPVGEKNVIWLSDECDFKEGKALRGGIPVCWPWFGNLDANPAQVNEQVNRQGIVGAHGFARDILWQVESIDIVDAHTTRVVLYLDFPGSRQWPFASVLRLTLVIARTLTVSLTVKNTDKSAFYFTSALHSYFMVGDIGEVEVQGLEASEYIDMVADWRSGVQEENLLVTGELDRVYPQVPSHVELCDKKLHRKIVISSDSFPSMVAWNPWIERAKELSNFNDLAYRTMLCLENANVLDHMKRLNPGEESTMAIEISCASL